MESPLRKVGGSPAQKEIPESAIVESDTITVPVGSEKIIIDPDYDSPGSDKYDHLEQEFKVLKGSIKKLIVDIREQMNNSENPFLNIQQMMPTQTPIMRDHPAETERPPMNDPVPETPVAKPTTGTCEKKAQDDIPPSRDAADRCPLYAGSTKTASRCPISEEYLSQDDIRQIARLLLAALNQGNGEPYFGQGRFDRQPGGNAFRPVPGECPAGLNAIPPCGMPLDPGRGIRCPVQPAPCTPRYRSGMQGNAVDGSAMQVRPYSDRPQMYGPRPYGCDYCQPREQGNGEYYTDYRPGDAGCGWNQQAQPGYRQRNDSPAGNNEGRLYNALPREDAREPGTGRQEPARRPHRAYQPAEDNSDGYSRRPTYDSHELPTQDRSARTPGKSRRKSLDSWTDGSDDGYIEPEPEPVVIEIPKPVSARKKRSARARSVPDMVVVDVEPENVVPPSTRSSRRRGL